MSLKGQPGIYMAFMAAPVTKCPTVRPRSMQQHNVSSKVTGKDVLFPDLNAEADDNGLSQIESLCFNCYKQGMTRLLLAKIPFFREVIISSFHCDECEYEDRSIQSGSRIEEKGVRYTLTVKTLSDLNRQVVKSDYAMLMLPDVDFEQPPNKRGEVTTVEGLLSAIVSGLNLMQTQRKVVDPEKAAKIEEFIVRLNKLKHLETSFDIIVDDPTGNSFVENPNAPARDEALTVVHYTRTHQQDVDIGIVAEDDEVAEDKVAEDEVVEDEVADENGETEEKVEKTKELKDEVLWFATNCSNCNAPCRTNMKLIDIPFFKQVVIMATVCDVCGKRDNEVKSGTGIEPLGTRITLHITDASDLNRDILKSDTCGVLIPELDLELMEGTLGGRFTTVEGLLTQIREQLEEKNPFITGDSSKDDTRSKITEFCVKLGEITCGNRLDVHLILDDPAGNSYMQNVYAPEADPEMTIEHYERSFDQNEILGLNDMKTENYSVTNSATSS